jgi:hypothetical protein
MIDAAGLADVQRLFDGIPTDGSELVAWVNLVAHSLGAPTAEALAWSETRSF